MAATLLVTREGTGIELVRGLFDVVVDDGTVGSVARGDSREIPVEAGSHTLRIRGGRYASRPRVFEVADGKVARFRCHGAMMWPRWVAAQVKRDLGISLHAE